MDMQKWIYDFNLQNDRRRIVFRFGTVTLENDLERVALWVLLPETISPEEMTGLVEKLATTCEENLKIKDVTAQ